MNTNKAARCIGSFLGGIVGFTVEIMAYCIIFNIPIDASRFLNPAFIILAILKGLAQSFKESKRN